MESEQIFDFDKSLRSSSYTFSILSLSSKGAKYTIFSFLSDFFFLVLFFKRWKHISTVSHIPAQQPAYTLITNRCQSVEHIFPQIKFLRCHDCNISIRDFVAICEGEKRKKKKCDEKIIQNKNARSIYILNFFFPFSVPKFKLSRHRLCSQTNHRIIGDGEWQRRINIFVCIKILEKKKKKLCNNVFFEIHSSASLSRQSQMRAKCNTRINHISRLPRRTAQNTHTHAPMDGHR